MLEKELEFLYNLPVYQHLGPGAYKPGLETTHAIDKAFGEPSCKFPSIHIAGTNGKGSTAHTLASILQEAGYKVGLYTSPHIFDFRERIRINGKKIAPEALTEFIEKYKALKLQVSPSFFELTTIMAFDYFAREKVDVAVIETGLGGRLDSTNIITPIVSIITNISMDHMALLGDTLEKIAAEKAGIITPGIPVVFGENDNKGVHEVITQKAHENHSKLIEAQPLKFIIKDDYIDYGTFRGELTGECQPKNTATILAALPVIKSHFPAIDEKSIAQGFAKVIENTGLMGRWQRVSSAPDVIIDTGHNIGAWKYTIKNLRQLSGDVHLILGFVADKDLHLILKLISEVKNMKIYFCQPNTPRGLKAEDLAAQASTFGLNGDIYHDVNQALAMIQQSVSPQGTIVIAGSNFLISDLKLDQ